MFFFVFCFFNADCGRAFLPSLPADEQCFYALGWDCVFPPGILVPLFVIVLDEAAFSW